MRRLQPPPRQVIKDFPVARVVGGFIERQPRPVIALGGYGLLGLLALIDYLLTPQHITVQLVYLVPIFIITWFIGPLHGAAAIAISAVINFAINFYNLSIFPNPWDPFVNDTLAVGVYLMAARTISVMRTLIETEQALARTDPVTGAANRHAFFELVEYELNRTRRTQQPCSVASIDLDNFKIVNDRWGHATGDLALCTVVTTLKQHIRATDQLARLGGDEFILFLPQTDAQAARITLDRVQAKLLAVMQANFWPITFSIGVATFTTPPESIEAALHRADEFMYGVKRNGKNRIEYRVIE